MINVTEKKSTSHNVIVRLLSEIPITYAAATFALAKSIDSDELDARDLVIIGYDFNDSEPGSPEKQDREPSKIGNKLKDLAASSPGALGKIYALIKPFKWYQIYIGFVGFVLMGTLLFKWAIRLITGTFF